MSDYRRLISYIYAYQGNEKGKNVGYAKIEVRKEQCRFFVSVKGVSLGVKDTCVFLLAPETEIFLGRIHIRGGNGEFRAVVNAGNIMQSKIPMQSCYGLVIRERENDREHLATIWEDAVAEEAEVTVMEVKAAETVEEENGEGSGEKVETKNEEEPEEKAAEAADQVKSVEKAETAEKETADEKAEVQKSDAEKRKSPEKEQDAKTIEILPESENEKTEAEQSTEDAVWRDMQKKYPKMLAFDYENGCEILRIRPQDIGLLPMELWLYGSNSFLLHGYYNFRHLIFARLENPDGAPRYLLGVPGHYYRAEKNMAAMFGFAHFVLAKNQPEQDERFGYWYVYIRL